jgi:hypothetical protein
MIPYFPGKVKGNLEIGGIFLRGLGMRIVTAGVGVRCAMKHCKKYNATGGQRRPPLQRENKEYYACPGEPV